MKTKLFSKLLYIAISFAVLTGTISAQDIRYVKQDGNGNGTSWAAASGDIQAMINSLKENGGEVWIAAGTYTPTSKIAEVDNKENATTDEDKAFLLAKDVKLYGGFTGNETELSARDWKKNPTILSGKLDDTLYAYHVVVISDTSGSSSLDGLIITEGKAQDIPDVSNTSVSVNKRTITRKHGAGIYIAYASPVLKNLVIRNNTSTGDGAGIYATNSPYILENSDVINNLSGGNGGGISNSSSKSFIINTSICNNEAQKGAGVYYFLGSNAMSMTNTVLSGNKASIEGGGIFGNSAHPVLTNVTIAGNTAVSDGGGYANASNTAKPTFRNCILWGNEVDGEESNVSEKGTPTYFNCIVGGDVNTLNVDPLFISENNYRLRYNSPAGGTGDTIFYSTDSIPDLSNITKDIDGFSMVTDGKINIGAYQNIGHSTFLDSLFVNNTLTALKNGSEIEYEITIEFTDSIMIKGVTEDPSAVINSEDIGLKAVIEGYNEFPIRITAADGNTTKTHKLGVTVLSNSGISNPKNNFFKLYPNPVDEFLYIESVSPIEEISIYNIYGKMQMNTKSVNGSINLEKLNKGIYILKVKTASEESFHKIIKN